MFELHENLKGEKVLVFVDRPRRPGERGLWMDIGHEDEKNISFFVNFNRKNGYQVEKDQRGFYRILVCND